MLTMAEAMRMRKQLERLASLITDDTEAQECAWMYPEWIPDGHEYIAGDRFLYGGLLYKVKDGMNHTSQADWTPDTAVSLYERAARDDETGDEDAPIAYNGNMALENGKRYTQDGVVYICFRDTGIAVYNALKDLVGLYVTVVE